ncbi:ketopantoate reductase PanE/ApbA C terminal-domain-containing protein [Chytriomyces sp. MP71]|nr:ketopantoate reductase PanE/ApbA C terminal-domain-containing protein [Chytriomyces sp. MP71]
MNTTPNATIRITSLASGSLTETSHPLVSQVSANDNALLVTTPAHAAVAAINHLLQSNRTQVQPPVLVILTNGVLAVYDRLVQQFHREGTPLPPIILGSTTHGAYRQDPEDHPYHIVHSGIGATLFGCPPTTDPRHPGVSRTLAALSAMTELHTTMPLAWQTLRRKLLLKLAINNSLNALTALFHVRNGALAASQEGRDLMRLLCDEMMLVPEMREGLEGIGSSDALLEQVVAVANATARNVNSMDAALIQGRETEIDFLNGHVLRMADAHKISLPVHDIIVKMVRFKSKQQLKLLRL